MPNRSRRPSPFAVRLLVAAALVASACVSAPQKPLRIGTSMWTGYEPLFLARDRGYLSHDTAKLVEYTSTSGSSRAFRNGAVDAVTITLDEVLKLRRAGVRLRVVLVTDISHGGDAILARSGIAGLGDLKGRRVGFENTSIGDYMLTRALQQVGLTIDDVEGVCLEFSEQERAFRNAEVDAVVTYEPVKTRLLAAGAQLMFDSTKIPGEIVDVLVVSDECVLTRRSQITEVLRSWFRALEDVATRRPDVLAAMAARQRISVDAFTGSLGGVRFPNLTENRRLLSASPPALREPAERLLRTMLAGRLLDAPVDLAGVFDGALLPGGHR